MAYVWNGERYTELTRKGIDAPELLTDHELGWLKEFAGDRFEVARDIMQRERLSETDLTRLYDASVSESCIRRAQARLVRTAPAAPGATVTMATAEVWADYVLACAVGDEAGMATASAAMRAKGLSLSMVMGHLPIIELVKVVGVELKDGNARVAELEATVLRLEARCDELKALADAAWERSAALEKRLDAELVELASALT